MQLVALASVPAVPMVYDSRTVKRASRLMFVGCSWRLMITAKRDTKAANVAK